VKDFQGKVSVITGAGSGIGRALAVELARRGSRLAISDINLTNVTETAERCRELGAEVRAYELDVADRAAFAAHADEVVGEFGAVNLAVNNAGVTVVGEFLDLSFEDWDWIMGINFWGVLHGSKLFLPHLIASGDGHLVNISSVFGFVGVPGQSAYNAAKFAVRGFTEALAQEMANAGHPVGVSSVHPGGIRTNIARSARGGSPQQADTFEKIARTSPETAARVILHGVERRHLRILIGPDAYGFEAMSRLLGPNYTGLVRRVAGRQIKPASSSG
jgi:NAD(P)-dependent dehydrogenase (short-subunit alcohol dehydrogenase family)